MKFGRINALVEKIPGIESVRNDREQLLPNASESLTVFLTMELVKVGGSNADGALLDALRPSFQKH